MDDPIRWFDAEPARFAREIDEVAAVAPELAWDAGRGGFEGTLPLWPFDRAQPAGLDGFAAGRVFRAVVAYPEAFPMVAPRIVPVDPEPPLGLRVSHAWHLNGDGSLCLIQGADMWDGTGSAAELIVKGASWFLEYLLMEDGCITEMSEHGIAADDAFDHLFAAEPGS